MPALLAFLDANVLYPAELRSFLIYLDLHGAFRARWSKEVQEEWIANLLRNRPDLTRMQLDRTRRLMDEAAPKALVSGYKRLISGLVLPDRNDRHVLAAAIHSGARTIVTKNLKDFPPDILLGFDIEPQHPDDFVLRLIESAPIEVCRATEAHRQTLRNPRRSVAEYLAILNAQGLSKSAEALRSLL